MAGAGHLDQGPEAREGPALETAGPQTGKGTLSTALAVVCVCGRGLRTQSQSHTDTRLLLTASGQMPGSIADETGTEWPRSLVESAGPVAAVLAPARHKRCVKGDGGTQAG